MVLRDVDGWEARAALLRWGADRSIEWSWAVWTDGEHLFVSSDFDRKLYVYRGLTGQSGTKPDLVYNLTGEPWGNALHRGCWPWRGEGAYTSGRTLRKP